MTGDQRAQPGRRTLKSRTILTIALLFVIAGVANAQKVIRLYPGAAPGSEKWTHQEKEYFSPIWNTQVVTNVSQPTLTLYSPEPAKALGTAVIICPGGGFHALSINSEGVEVARWLAARGVTAFVLKYRLVPTGDDGVKEVMAKIGNRQKLNADNAAVVPLAVADGLAAVSYVRKHAAEFGISPQRIGLMGFSAGGTVTAAVAFQYSAESRPDFVAPIYPYMGAVPEAAVPPDAPPMFIAAASDDELGLAPDSISLYSKWLAAGKSVEIHIYSKGGHGFGMRKKNLPSDYWIDRFGDWLQIEGRKR
ncbi:MAG TPA: alpha/beta hydrolase [Blastocatellia bacterium]|nr:alpha/beta hydrolase [Blastocatellia bacterium]